LFAKTPDQMTRRRIFCQNTNTPSKMQLIGTRNEKDKEDKFLALAALEI
jgi:hypothetical protein